MTVMFGEKYRTDFFFLIKRKTHIAFVFKVFHLAIDQQHDRLLDFTRYPNICISASE